MRGGWTMSMAWMRLPGQTWIEAAGSFLIMWLVMMAAMMLPSLAPILWRYCQSVRRMRETPVARLTLLVGIGYFFVWTLLGLAVYPMGVAIAGIEMEQPILAHAVPLETGIIVLIAGALQLTRWKAYHLSCCRETPELSPALTAHAGAAWKLGLHFGLHCGLSCANLTVILLVLGMMDFRVMAATTAAITAERLAPGGVLVARFVGAVFIGTGLFLIVRAAWLQ